MLVCVSAYITISYLTDNNKTKELFLSRKNKYTCGEENERIVCGQQRRHKYLKIYKRALERYNLKHECKFSYEEERFYG